METLGAISPLAGQAPRLDSTVRVQPESTFRDILSSAVTHTDAYKVKNAAKQFEGLIIGQMLKSMHDAAGSGWLGTGDDQSGSTALELAEEQFAQAMASGGGLGLGTLVEKALTNAPKTASSGPNPR